MEIKFKDGTSITAEQNGSCYITATKPEFPEDLTEVTVGDEELHNVRIVECASVDGRYWFTMLQATDGQLQAEQMRADIDYLMLSEDE